jgi:regulatory protein
MAERNIAANYKVPRKVTRKSLEISAFYYLRRYSSSSENLRRILLKRVKRSAQYHGTDVSAGLLWVNEIIEKFLANKLLDDIRYAETKCLSVHRKGGSKQTIRKKLQEKGIAPDIIEQTFTLLDQYSVDPELIAAAITARRRRLGPYRSRGHRNHFRERDLASLARAGFNYSIASWVIDVETIDHLEKDVGFTNW